MCKTSVGGLVVTSGGMLILLVARYMGLGEQADKDFSRARRRAFLRRIGAYLRKEPSSNQLLSFAV
jgi:hypothetical protein